MGDGDRHKHKARGVRVPDERWEAAKKKAEAEGLTLNDVVNGCLEKFLKQPPKKKK
jgi:predicted HicB family RNase H-like nuclease